MAGIFLLCRKLSKTRVAVILATYVVVLFVLTLARGSDLNRSLPFFAHYHNPLKILTGLAVPLILLTGFALDALSRSRYFQIAPSSWTRTVYLALSMMDLNDMASARRAPCRREAA